MHNLDCSFWHQSPHMPSLYNLRCVVGAEQLFKPLYGMGYPWNHISMTPTTYMNIHPRKYSLNQNKKLIYWHLMSHTYVRRLAIAETNKLASIDPEEQN